MEAASQLRYHSISLNNALRITLIKSKEVFKIRKITLAIIIIGMLFLAGCGGECKTSTDCKATNKCDMVNCVEKKCSHNFKPNCCGNGQEDALENGKPGSKCSCPEDYGACEGRGKIEYRQDKFMDTKFLQRFCEGNECIFGVPKENIVDKQLVDEKEFSFFTLGTIITYKEPFDITADSFKFRFTLKDDSADLVYPIKLTSIQVLRASEMLGEKVMTTEFIAVGNSDEVIVPLSYTTTKLEEYDQALGFKLYYEYTKRIKISSEEYREELVRDSYQGTLKSKINFVNPKGKDAQE